MPRVFIYISITTPIPSLLSWSIAATAAAAAAAIIDPSPQTSKSSDQILLVQEIGLALEVLGGKNEVIGDNGELVEDEDMCYWSGNCTVKI